MYWYWLYFVPDLSFILLLLIVSLHSEQFTSDILSIWDYDLSVDQYNVYGGTGKASVTAQIENLQTWLQQWTHLQTWLQQ